MKTIITSLKIFLLLTLLTGVVYPLLITGIAQALFPAKANGSMIRDGKTIIGSRLIGQQFDSSIYFMSRPSAIAYNPMPSSGSNYGLTNTKQKDLVSERRKHFYSFNTLDSLSSIPSEMLFASGSGLDPHISPEAAILQVERIATERHFDVSKRELLLKKIEKLTEKPQFLILGEDRINVLILNIELDKMDSNHTVSKQNN